MFHAWNQAIYIDAILAKNENKILKWPPCKMGANFKK